MKTIPTRLLALLAPMLLTLAPVTAFAGAAGGGSISCDATEQIRFVEDTNGNGLRDPGEETDCTTAVVDTTDEDNPIITNGSGTVCVPAAIAQARGTVTLIVDDNAKDNHLVANSPPQFTGQVLTMLIEVRANDQIIRVADSFTAPALNDLYLGNWDNRLGGEPSAFGVKFKGALFLTPTTQDGSAVTEGAFDDMGDKLAAVAQSLGLVPDANLVIPIVADPIRDGQRKRFVEVDPNACGNAGLGVANGCGELEADESGSDLATIAVYRVTFSFAEKLPGAPPSCS